jgi:nucleoside-triphosphatase
MKSVYLLMGMPGTGKTSLIHQVTNQLGDKAGGFYTEEIRVQGIRRGFRIVTLDGQAATLAHVNIKSPHRVSKYGVDVETLEKVGVAALQKAFRQCDVIVVDEIGKMELFSERFKEAALEIIESGKKVLGSIMLKSDPWADLIKQKPQVKLITITRNNHGEVMEEIEEVLCPPNCLR